MANNSINDIKLRATSIPITFASRIAEYQIKHNFISIRDLYESKFEELCKDKRIGLSLFYSYCNGSVVPGMSNAEFIFDVLEIPYEKNKLKKLLEVSSDEKVEYGINSYSATVSFPLRNICNFIEEEYMIEGLLKRRINSEGKGSFSKYVAGLIKKDLQEWNMKGEEAKEEISK